MTDKKPMNNRDKRHLRQAQRQAEGKKRIQDLFDGSMRVITGRFFYGETGNNKSLSQKSRSAKRKAKFKAKIKARKKVS